MAKDTRNLKGTKLLTLVTSFTIGNHHYGHNSFSCSFPLSWKNFSWILRIKMLPNLKPSSLLTSLSCAVCCGVVLITRRTVFRINEKLKILTMPHFC